MFFIPNLVLAYPTNSPQEVYCGNENLVTLTRNFDSKGRLTKSLNAWIQFKTAEGKVKLYQASKSYDSENEVVVFTSKNKRYTLTQKYLYSDTFDVYFTKSTLTDKKTGETMSGKMRCHETEYMVR